MEGGCIDKYFYIFIIQENMKKLLIGALLVLETIMAYGEKIAESSAIKVLGKDKVMIGRIATGDQFIANKEKVKFLGEQFQADAVEMEGAAVAQVAQIYEVPFVVLRALSDKADGEAEITYDEFVQIAANNSAKIVKEMLKNMK